MISQVHLPWMWGDSHLSSIPGPLSPTDAPNAPTEVKIQSGPKSALSDWRECNTEDTPSRAKEHLQIKQNTFLIS